MDKNIAHFMKKNMHVANKHMKLSEKLNPKLDTTTYISIRLSKIF